MSAMPSVCWLAVNVMDGNGRRRSTATDSTAHLRVCVRGGDRRRAIVRRSAQSGAAAVCCEASPGLGGVEACMGWDSVPRGDRHWLGAELHAAAMSIAAFPSPAILGRNRTSWATQ